MFRFLVKYAPLIYLLNTILLSIESTFSIGYNIFLLIMVVYLLLIIVNPIIITNVILNKSFKLFLYINIINLIYFILFHNIKDIEALKYIIARFMQFSLLTTSVYYHFDYYRSNFLRHIIFILFYLILLGFVINTNFLNVRYTGIFWNPNMLASFSTIGFGITLILNNKLNRFYLLLLFVFFVTSLLTGSRGVMIGVPLAFVFRYGFSYKNILYAIFGSLIYIFSISLELETSADRFSEKELFASRWINYQIAFNTITEKPFTGYGLDKYSGETTKIPHYLRGLGKSLTAHNGYLSILIQYGFIFGFIIIFLIFRYCFLLFYFFIKSDNIYITSYLYIIFYTLIASIYETLITGINDFHTILFWLSISYLIFYKYQLKNES